MKIINKLEKTIEELEGSKSKFYKKINEQQPQIQFRLNISHLFEKYLDKYNLSVQALYDKLIVHYGKENINFGIRTFEKLVSNQVWQGGAGRDQGLKNFKLKILLICREVLGVPIRDFLEIREIEGKRVKPSLKTFYNITVSKVENDFSIFNLWPVMQTLKLNLSHLDALFEIVHTPQGGGFNDNDKGWLLSPPVYDDRFGKFVSPLIAKFDKPFSLGVEIHLPLPHDMPLVEKLVLHKSNAKSPFRGDENLGWYAKEIIHQKITTKLLTKLTIEFVNTMSEQSEPVTYVKFKGLNDNETN